LFFLTAHDRFEREDVGRDKMIVRTGQGMKDLPMKVDDFWMKGLFESIRA
jgi:hypothetical protein